MAYYMVSTKQVAGTAFTIAVLVASVVLLLISIMNYYELPEVYVDSEGKCVKVVNYKNGDSFTCEDRHVTLRKYHLIHTAK